MIVVRLLPTDLRVQDIGHPFFPPKNKPCVININSRTGPCHSLIGTQIIQKAGDAFILCDNLAPSVLDILTHHTVFTDNNMESLNALPHLYRCKKYVVQCSSCNPNRASTLSIRIVYSDWINLTTLCQLTGKAAVGTFELSSSNYSNRLPISINSNCFRVAALCNAIERAAGANHRQGKLSANHVSFGFHIGLH